VPRPAARIMAFVMEGAGAVFIRTKIMLAKEAASGL
jgi:hypothetical protein